MPLVNKIKPMCMTQENGKIIAQNGGFGSVDNHCCVPLEETNTNDLAIGYESNPRLEWLDDPAQAKNFWLTFVGIDKLYSLDSLPSLSTHTEPRAR
ncbi:hypothetical protein HNY73_016847 [Argiope bruennichi]|uniref:Uncharacterized protein n=1 Tax=Argiope bruennichi TaxID=94029 RepID=A0A8T0EQ23_ARGBR|nr:hypothetical protein HNY73_016847 [Argiope bruennichi]